MKKLLSCAAALALFFAAPASADPVPAGKENLIIDSMSKAREAEGKKPIKGPVPLAHQAHADKVACNDCHHKEQPGEEPLPCSDCHSDKKGDAPTLKDAFHGKGALPPLQSCIGCHQRKGLKDSTAPQQQKPCEVCHSILKK